LGYEGVLSSDAEVFSSADAVIFPGVGEAGSAMGKLKETGLDRLIPELRQPVLGICLGMQLMCRYSEEGDTTGLGIFDAKVQKFPSMVKVPQKIGRASCRERVERGWGGSTLKAKKES